MRAEIFLKKRKYQRKGALKQKIEASQYTLQSGFKKIPFTLYTYVLATILKNGAKIYTKADSWFQKSDEEFGQRWATFVQTLYTEDSSNITFNYLSVKSHQIPYTILETISHFFTTQLLCIFLAQTLHTFYKNRTSKYKLSDLPLLALKFTKFLMSFLEGRVNFFFNFCITLQCHEAWFVFTFSSKSIWKNACGNIAKFFMSFLKAQISCHSSSASILSAIKHDSSVLFQLKHYILWSKEPIRMLRSKFVKFLTSVLN